MRGCPATSSESTSEPRTRRSPTSIRRRRPPAGRSCTPSSCRRSSPPAKSGRRNCCRRSSICRARTTSRPVRSTYRGSKTRRKPWARSPAITVRRCRAGSCRAPNRGSAIPASIAPRRFYRGRGRPTCRGFRRSKSRHATSGTSSKRGTPFPIASPTTGSKSRPWSSRCRRRSTTWPATSPPRPRSKPG